MPNKKPIEERFEDLKLAIHKSLDLIHDSILDLSNESSNWNKILFDEFTKITDLINSI